MIETAIPPRRRPLTLALAAALAVAAAGATAQAAVQARRELPEGPPIDGFEQLLPRGAIAALVELEFVPAADAGIPDGAWVLGFASQGRSYAYDLNLLNRHEVVNHTIGDLPVAAVW